MVPSRRRLAALVVGSVLLACIPACDEFEPPTWTWYSKTAGIDHSVSVAAVNRDEVLVLRDTTAYVGDPDVVVLVDRNGAERSLVEIRTEDGEVSSSAIAVDADGGFHVAGSFEGTARFDGSPQTYSSRPCADTGLGCDDGFVASYDADGRLRWVTTFAEDGVDRVAAITVHEGLVWVAGSVGGLDASPMDDVVAEDVNTLFVATLDDAGEKRLQYRDPSVGSSGEITDVAVSRDGSAWFAAGYAIVGGVDTVVAHISSTGDEVLRLHAPATHLAIATHGDLVITGEFQGTIELGPTRLRSSGERDVFVARYSTTEAAYVWAASFGSRNPEVVYDAALDPRSNVVLIGRVVGSLDVAGTIVGDDGDDETFVAVADGETGAVLRITGLGAELDDYPDRLLVLGTDDIVVSGTFGGILRVGDERISPVDIRDGYARRFDPFPSR